MYEVSNKINDLQQQITNNENQRVILQKKMGEWHRELIEIELSLRCNGCEILMKMSTGKMPILIFQRPSQCCQR
jgi:hypothetical protein